jgi:hypothetical protein
MQQIYQHPWYKQQELLESTTTSESESTQRVKPEPIGLKSTRSIEWAAGLFEGEGCLTYQSTVNKWKLCIKMTDEDVILDFYEAVGYLGNFLPLSKSPSTPDHWKPSAEWNVYARDTIFEIVVRLYPYLGNRRQAKIKEFLTWYMAWRESKT